MLERLGNRYPDGIDVWCTNLEYDLLNLFGIERLHELALRFGKSYLVRAQWRKHKIHFRDTIRHVPVSVESLGELIGLEKVERDLFESGQTVSFERLLRRCLRDASITYQAARRLTELYQEMNTRPRLTLASSAYHIWAEQFWRREVRRPLDEHWEAAFEAYYGGRTEPFNVGTFERVRACDASSMFPWAMTAAPLPLPWGRHERTRPGAEALHETGFYRARIDASGLRLPVLPYRSTEGLVFPTGRWSGWYVGGELTRHAEAGGRFRVLEGFNFREHVRPFDGYIAEMFNRKKKSQGARRLFYKLLLNSLYGKFGQRGERVMAIPLEQFARLENQPIKYRIWAGLALFSETHQPPPWGNNVWPAIVTARARVRLHREMCRLLEHNAKPLYCDTDGILYQAAKSFHSAEAPAIGEFETRGIYRTALIRAKKEYALQAENGSWQFFVKGVPFAAREEYLRNGAAEFQRPVKLREASRSGERPNVWRLTRKTRHVNFDKRGRRPDGSLLPVQVDG